jgi:hypothetical protein
VTLALGERVTTPPVWLKLDEAVALCTAWLQSEARVRNTRVLILKGDALNRQGLRPPRVSSDVDLLVEPARFDDFVGALESNGWRQFDGTFASEQFTSHSRALRREGWPNSIDVHSSWPGFLEPAVDVFETLWARRVSMNFAHQLCNAPDRIANVLMLALHSLRGSTAQVRHLTELEGVLQLELTPEELSDLADLAIRTGCVGPLRAVLPELGVRLNVSRDELRGTAYLDWHRKIVQTHTQGRTASWLIELRRLPWRRKPLILRHGFWPTDRDLLAEHPEVPDRFAAKVWARIMRLIRGLGQLPRVIPALRRR